MAIAWSRLSSKVIAPPPEANVAYRRRCRNWQGHSSACIPHRVDKRKQEVLGVRDAEETPFSATRGGLCTDACAYFNGTRLTRCKGGLHVPSQTMDKKTRESQTAP